MSVGALAGYVEQALWAAWLILGLDLGCLVLRHHHAFVKLWPHGNRLLRFRDLVYLNKLSTSGFIATLTRSRCACTLLAPSATLRPYFIYSLKLGLRACCWSVHWLLEICFRRTLGKHCEAWIICQSQLPCVLWGRLARGWELLLLDWLVVCSLLQLVIVLWGARTFN
jgi:hypothetical protein